MNRREELLRVATELLAARLRTQADGSLGGMMVSADDAVAVAAALLEAVDRRCPAKGATRGGPEDR